MRDAAEGDNHTQYDSVAMAIHFEAVYERGVLRPLEPLTLAEHQRVHVSVDERTRWRALQRDPYDLRKRAHAEIRGLRIPRSH